jgi:CheY-like chemotaxis protein
VYNLNVEFMAKILHVGTSEAVMTTRRAILERAGHEVTLARNMREVIAGCERESFDVAIVSQSLPAQEKNRVTGTVLELCKGAKILEYHDAIAPDVPTADAHLHVASSSPESLVETVETLTRSKT